MTNPVDAAFPTTGTGIRGDVVSFIKQRVLVDVFSVAELQGNDFSDHRYLRVITTDRIYAYSATETGADDGASILRDSVDNAFVWVPTVNVSTLFDHVGTGAPSSGLGADGDTYFDAASGDVYLKDSGSWGTAIGNLKGATGDPGSSDVVGTSATSRAIGTGAKAFTVAETGRGWGVGARLRASSDADGANFMEGVVTAYSGTSLTISVDLVGGSGTLDDWTISLAGERGVAGFVSGYRFAWSSTVTDSDPGAGNVRFNNATLASVTELYIDNEDASGGDVTGWLDGLDDSTTASHKGYMRFEKSDDPGVYAEFVVTGSVTDGTGYRKVPASLAASAGTLTDADAIVATFRATGNKGADGAGLVDSVNGQTGAVVLDADDIGDTSTTKKHMARVHVVATSNVDISTGLEAGDSIDGVTLVEDMVALLTAQTDASENGVYDVPASGAASRNAGFAAYDDHPGTLFTVMQGTAYAGTLWQCTSPRGGTLDTTAIAIQQGPNKPAFRANKNATNQTGIAASTATKITFTTEVFDVGGYYDAANSKWTPPAGKYLLGATVKSDANIVDGTRAFIYIYKNGARVAATNIHISNTGTVGAVVVCLTDADGDDYFEVYWYQEGTGDKTINGDENFSFFWGVKQ